ncbi:hypothetical protein HMPREF9318_00079 [Streptococcus urinalis FB127-CNA-2]|uniref:Uncharacterized protein n=1 Tax=Streptococcus urinalis 2285-97 TaxID=764291 RepID=G5KEI3_9STRE|nr:hypothetical protein STRUR_0817 [Streptococcus urinalis 2285-97]EKS21881.1 hypothetical protein HMPREF9318_00079 [Streptococcus urinalis FB127-CNA-2]QBX22141.1 hypothetical protein Javan637_0033 [Streptococcus phage Javan637]QBX31597.1 hypothetical protein Javan642_0033 [Streptococcus phage Javan642]QBX31658.1 hypothetical protein Javan648_0032 [Streptococcus phage Javan648]VEF31694.1 Uncharacterised protein [Streptococcus urinalis]
MIFLAGLLAAIVVAFLFLTIMVWYVLVAKIIEYLMDL